jgi:glucose/arabinose dehydrogenase
MFKKIVLGSFMVAALALPAQAQTKVKLEPLVTGVNTPLAMVQVPGENRMFVIEQFGRVRVIEDGKLLPEPLIDIRNKLPTLYSDFDERGLLALHPDFANNGKFYLAHSTPIDFQLDLAKEFWWDHTNVIEEYQVTKDNPNIADPSSARLITSIDWPQFNHNGHWIGFGPDGMLYFSVGDGGYANDWGIGHNVTEGNGQDSSVLHGKILRIDVNGSTDGMPYAIPADNPFVGNPDIPDDIWATGFRNPWRCSFDTDDGRLFCGDVQQNSYEEVDIVEKGKNYGWRKMEANHCFDYVKPNDHPAECGDTSGFTGPIIEYNNCTAQPDGCKGISVTGGYVYRGATDAWKGKYIFGDWSKNFGAMDGQIFIGSEGSDGKWTMEVAEVEGMDGATPYILAFAQDADGEVYALTSITTGPVGSLDTIYKIVPAGM